MVDVNLVLPLRQKKKKKKNGTYNISTGYVAIGYSKYLCTLISIHMFVTWIPKWISYIYLRMVLLNFMIFVMAKSKCSECSCWSAWIFSSLFILILYKIRSRIFWLWLRLVLWCCRLKKLVDHKNWQCMSWYWTSVVEMVICT